MTRDEKNKKNYHAYCCKLSKLVEDGEKVKILGFGEWLEMMESLNVEYEEEPEQIFMG